MTTEEMLKDKSICPLSLDHPMFPNKISYKWWRMQGDDVCCSWCGSWHPHSFIEFISKALDPMDTESMIELADRRQKVYVTRDGIRTSSQGAIKAYLVHINQYADKNSLDIPAINKALHEAFIVSNDKFSIHLAIVREKMNNNID